MFGLLRLAIWLSGLIVVTYFVLGFFGYEVNLDYFKSRQDSCKTQLLACQADLVKKGIEGAKASEQCGAITCLDTHQFIYKK